MRLVAAALLLSLVAAGCVRVSEQPVASPSAAPPVIKATSAPQASTQAQLATGVPQATLQVTPTASAKPRDECTDSDGGKNYSVRGLARAVDANGKATNYEDYCANSRDLNEYYCEAREVASANYSCPGACVAGSCGDAVESGALGFTLVSTATDAFITPCLAPEIVFNVLRGPGSAIVSFHANYSGKLSGSFNPAAYETGRDGFAETRLITSAGCSTLGSVVANFTAQACKGGACANKTLSINFTAGRCLGSTGCDRNESIAS